MMLSTIRIYGLLLLTFVYGSFTLHAQPSAVKPRLIIPFGHQLGIRSTLFSPDNRFLITADEKITIISDVRSGKPLFYCAGTNPAISTDGRYISTVAGRLALVWETASGQLLQTLELPSMALRTEFHPTRDLLLIEHWAGGDEKDPGSWFYNESVWDFTNTQVSHEFRSDDAKEEGIPANCSGCTGKQCPIAGAWFTGNGDSIRVVYAAGSLRTYPLSSYHHPVTVCLTRADRDPGMSVKILDDRIIKLSNSEQAHYFNGNGTFIGSLSYRNQRNIMAGAPSVNECISQAGNFQADYTDNKIALHDLTHGTTRYFEVKGLRKLSFNRAGTYLLAEFLDETPRLFATADFLERQYLSPQDYDGWPAYIYETRTDRDQEVSIFDSIEAKIPHLSATAQSGLSILVGDPMASSRNMMSKMKYDYNSSYTNSGYIVNLANKRMISRIVSRIKLSGDIRLSPDNKTMLLNSGKSIALYSIPYARIVKTLTGPHGEDVFSPDSRWLVQYAATGQLRIISLVNGRMATMRLKLKSSMHNYIRFTPDSRQVTIISGEGGYARIDVASAAVLAMVENKTYYPSPDGRLYGLVDIRTHTAHLYRTADSSQLFSTMLPDPGKNSENSYRISFSANSPALAIWNPRTVICFNDYQHPSDTTITIIPDNNFRISLLTLSPNGAYLHIQTDSRLSLIYDRATKHSFFTIMPSTPTSIDTRSIGQSMRSIFSGNLDELMGSREMAQFSSTGDTVMACLGDSVVFYRSADSVPVMGWKAPGEIKFFSFKDNLLVVYHLGQLQFYHISDREEWFSMIPFTNGETVFLLPNGTYFGNRSASRLLGYISDARSLSYKQFDYNNNRPDIVLRKLGNTDKGYLAIYDSVLAIRRRREGLHNAVAIAFDKAPEVTILNDKDIRGEVKEKDLPLQLHINSPAQAPDRLAVFVNGNPLGGPGGIKLSRRHNTMDTTVRVSLNEGSNIIEVSVFDVAGSESYRQPLYIQCFPDSPIVKKVYFAGIGAQHYRNSAEDLAFAIKDINAFVDSLRQYYGGDRIVVNTLFDKQVTWSNIRRLKAKLLPARADDIVIVYYSGHGVVDEKNVETYFGTWDLDFNHPADTALTIKDLSYLTENIPSRNKVIFLDACHSGELNKYGGLTKKADRNIPKDPFMAGTDPGAPDPFDLVLNLFTDHYQGDGTNIIVAARGGQVAKEDSSIGHGLFTYAVLEGLSHLKADADSNAILTIGELQNYVVDEVPRLLQRIDTSIVQQASLRNENEYNDWYVAKSGKAVIGRRTMVHELSPNDPVFSQINDDKRLLKNANRRELLTDSTARADVLDQGKQAVNTFKGLFGSQTAKKLKDYQRASHPNAISLFTEGSREVSYEVVEGNIVFTITCPGSTPALFFDVNANGVADRCIDRVYTATASSENICAGYIAAPGQISQPDGQSPCGIGAKDCKASSSRAAMLKTAESYLFMIPVSEVSMDKKLLKAAFRFYDAGSQSATTFGKILEIRLEK